VHHCEGDTVVLADVDERDDVRMGQLGEAADFAREAAGEGGVVNEVRPRHFDDDIAFELVVARQVDVGHAAFTELAQHAVTPVAQSRAGPFGRIGEHG